MAAASISVIDVSKSFVIHSKGRTETKPALSNISLNIAPATFATVVGPNGSGKTTLLRVIAGLIQPDAGDVDIQPMEGQLGFVFQNYRESLFPWMSVIDNITVPLHAKMTNRAAQSVAEDFISANNLGFLHSVFHRYPYELSAGQQQLVGIVRAFIHSPACILMDEPFASLDFAARQQLQDVVHTLWSNNKSTVLFVSHDLEEGIYLGQKLFLLSPAPGTLLTEVEVTLPTPRQRDDQCLTSIAKLKAGVLAKYQALGLDWLSERH